MEAKPTELWLSSQTLKAAELTVCFTKTQVRGAQKALLRDRNHPSLQKRHELWSLFLDCFPGKTGKH